MAMFPIKESAFMMGNAGKIFGNFALDSSTDELWAPFRIETTNDITHLGYNVFSITGSPPVYQISMEGLNSSGNPDGTPKCSATWTPTASNWEWRAVGTPYTPTYGEMVAIRVKYSSGTINASNLATFRSSWQSSSGIGWGWPYVVTVNSGTPTRASNPCPLAYKTASNVYGFPISTNSDRTFNSSSGTNKYATRFNFPAGLGDTYTVVGALFDGVTFVSGNTVDIKMYAGGGASDTTSTTVRSFDTDCWQVSAGSGRAGIIPFDQVYTCNYGSTYRLSVEPSTTGNVSIDYWDVSANADLEAWEWAGINMYQSERSSGNWTDTDTRRLSVYPIIETSTEPTGGGGGAILIPHHMGSNIVVM